MCGRFAMGQRGRRDDLHVDAIAVAGVIGQLVGAGGGANDQHVRGGIWIVAQRAQGNRVVRPFAAIVPRGLHDHNLRFAKVRCA